MKDPTHTALHVGGHQLHAAMNGHPAGAATVGTIWAVNKLVKFFTDAFKCNNCGREFTR